MKRVFKFKKGASWDGDEELYEFIEDYLLEQPPIYEVGGPHHRKNWKVTIQVDEMKLNEV